MVSISVARERRTRIPPSAAAVRAAASNAVLPIPAGPSTTTNLPRPVRASASADSIWASSSCRSSSGSVATATFMCLQPTPHARKVTSVATVDRKLG